MKQLETIHIVQFSFFEAESFETRGNLTLLGPNGVGKTSVLDAVQIAMLGAHGTYVAYNSQSVSSKQRRTLKDYCLGTMHSVDGASDNTAATVDTARASLARKRDHAQSYITLVFRDTDSGVSTSAGVCLSATVLEPDHRLRGLYVSPGIELTLEDHLQAFDEGTLPLDWESFEVELQRRAKAAGRTPHVSTHPEAYVEELLHAIQPAARYIDRHAFVRAFKKSMQLKDIENVNDFVRDYLVDAQPINKQAALTQINRFKQLKTLIRETEEQIERLGQISKEHTALRDVHRRRDTIHAVKARLLVEFEQKNVERLTSELADIDRKLADLRPQIASVDEQKNRFALQIEELIEQIARDPASADLEHNNKLRAALQSRLNDNRGRLDEWHFEIRQTLQTLRDTFVDSESDIASTVGHLLQRFDAIATDGSFAETPLLKETLESLRSLQTPITMSLDTAKQTKATAELALKALLGQAKAIAQGAGRLSPSVGAAINIFQEHGIDAQPISALVEIKDRDWQAAIEAFLGRNRESLVVERGKERNAIQLLRQFHEDADWLYDVTVVQPAHLDIAKHRTPAKETVAALIVGRDEIAITYVRQLLGEMRCVKTEADLESYPRALTTDGMMSANGGTRRLRRPDAGHLRIGMKLSSSQQQELYQEVVRAQQVHDQIKRQYGLFAQASDAVRETLKSVSLVSYAEVRTALCDSHAQIATLPDAATIKEPKLVFDLRSKKQQASESHKKLEAQLIELRYQEVTSTTTAAERNRELASSKTNLETLGREHQLAVQAQDFDTELELDLYQEATESQDNRLFVDTCAQIYSKATDRIRIILNRVLPTFSQYLECYNVSLIDERTDWRKAKSWVEASLSKLKDSELIAYKEEADEAIKAAEDAFRQDIAYRLREAIQKLEQGIHQLNKILEVCPAFSGNERYKFVAQPAKAHERIYDFIKHINDREGTSGSLLANTDDARQEILDLLEASASSDAKRLQNPLEDYRLLYNFDLAIYQGAERVDWLSRRIGVASNGEHRVPFYVIAGAALAAAYRHQAGKPNDGAALMLLDEAFYGMDSQNSYATAQFLHNLGLQLIMAGPEADQGKLAPMTNSLYELIRYGADVFCEPTHFTEQMRQLMTSDMPMLHPQLIDEAEKAIVDGKT